MRYPTNTPKEKIENVYFGVEIILFEDYFSVEREKREMNEIKRTVSWRKRCVRYTGACLPCTYSSGVAPATLPVSQIS